MESLELRMIGMGVLIVYCVCGPGEDSDVRWSRALSLTVKRWLHLPFVVTEGVLTGKNPVFPPPRNRVSKKVGCILSPDPL